tara:strand:+ start:5387 stop:5650 length:264 start_codon:yes stop_codon:yes gene_type:complete
MADINAVVVDTSNINATVQNPTSPQVAVLNQTVTFLNDVFGVVVDYGTVANNYTLIYDPASNNFVAGIQTSALPAVIDGGQFDSGTF